MRKLVVNADDFGFTRDVNQGIVEAYRNGILTSTTLMATGAAFDDAVCLARENSALDIGVHLVLVGEPPFPITIAQLMRAMLLGRIRVYEELRAQVRRILDAGLEPTHLDTHKHTHLLPPVLDAVARLSEEYKIPWVRRPFDFPLTPATRPGCRVGQARHQPGFGRRAQPVRARAGPPWLPLHRSLRRIPDHRPLRCGGIGSVDSCAARGLYRIHVPPRNLRRRTPRRPHPLEGEPRARTARSYFPEVRAALAESGVELVSYRSL